MWYELKLLHIKQPLISFSGGQHDEPADLRDEVQQGGRAVAEAAAVEGRGHQDDWGLRHRQLPAHCQVIVEC